MQYRLLGRSGLKVSPLALGAMMFGGPAGAATSERIIRKAFDAGINTLDTADQYNTGRSEEVCGEALHDTRRNWILATKVANSMGPSPNQSGLSRRWINLALEGSLKRLRTDYVDIYYLHREDPNTPLEEPVAAMGDLVRQGKIRFFGLSNFRSWRVAEICAICDRLGIGRPIVSQPYYNAMNRMPEVEHLPACAYYGVGIMPYSPLARGVLSGKYEPGAPPAQDTRAGRQDKRIMEAEWREESLQIAQTIKRHAQGKGITAGQFAVNWVLNNALVAACIIGPRTEAQLDEYTGALAYRFDADDEKLVDRLVTPGHPSTPGYNDPQYPIEGRVPRTSVPRVADEPVLY
jgi:aryl-alcohol dehydrogenase-like predicted oxidoreductase